MPISPARTTAFDILSRIESEKAYSSILLPAFTHKLRRNDRALCYEITYGVLRRQIYLDRVTDQFSGGRKLDPEVRNAIRIGLYQLYFLDRVPAHSAVNESVDLAGRAGKKSAKGFVNAILRRAESGRPELEYSDELDRISVETSHPRWLVERWEAEFGRQTAQKIAAANNQTGRTAFRFTARTLSYAQRPDWQQSAAPSDYVKGCFFVERINQELLELERQGEIYFQDEASQLVANSIKLLPGERFLDACAAPGGKITSIAARYGHSGNLLIAGELHSRRVDFLSENCVKQGANAIKIVQFDAENPFPFAEAVFDVVLVDAPCSGTGTIRHNPEIRYLLQPGDFGELSSKQLRILNAASKMVRHGGKLVYSTCSLELEENERVCCNLLESVSDFSSVPPDIPERFLTPEGFGKTWPHRDGMDGFFIASFLRR